MATNLAPAPQSAPAKAAAGQGASAAGERPLFTYERQGGAWRHWQVSIDGRVATVEETPRGPLLHIQKQGMVRAFTKDGKWAVSVRAMADKYVGLARCRHFERKEGDDE